MKLKYVVVYQELPDNYCAYLPELPGCISAADTWEEIQEMVREAVTLHLESMLEDGDPLPEGGMSLEDAMTYHCQPLSREEGESLAELGDDWPALRSTTFAPVEVEVPTPQAVVGD